MRRSRTGLPSAVCRRGYMLGELISALGLIVATATLITLGAAGVMRIQKRVAENAATAHRIESLLAALRSDARASLSARLDDDTDGIGTLELDVPDGHVRYRFDGPQVKRQADGAADRPNVPSEWHIAGAVVRADFQPDGSGHGAPSGGPGGRGLLTIDIQWRCQSAKGVEPPRRLSATFFVDGKKVPR